MSHSPDKKNEATSASTTPFVELANELIRLGGETSLSADLPTGVDAMLRSELWHPGAADCASVAAIRGEVQSECACNFRQALTHVRSLIDSATESEAMSAVRERAGAIIAALDAGARDYGLDTTDSSAATDALLVDLAQSSSSADTSHIFSVLSDFSKLEQILFDQGRASREERALTVIRALQRTLGTIGSDATLSAAVNGVSENLQEIWRAQCLVKVVTDLPRLMADGLMRTRIYHLSPEGLTAMERSKGWPEVDGLPVADVAIIGGGPGGLASAYHGGRLGLRTVVFESGYFGQAFSDARAKAVHAMRTGAKGSSLFREGVVPTEVSEQVDLPAIMRREGLRAYACEARGAFQAATGRRFVCTLPGPSNADDMHVPITRGELFAYLACVADSAGSFPDVCLVEQAPATRVTKRPDGLYRVESAAGHVQLAKKLVVATGFVGSEGEFERKIPDLVTLCADHAGKYLLLNDENDLVQRSREVDAVHQELRAHRDTGAPVTRQVIMSEVAMGHQEGQLVLALLPQGARVAVVGSGEGAAKAALEIRAQNPGLHVSLFIKSGLEPSQSQTPPSPGNQDTMRAGIFDDRLGRILLERWMDKYGTPITPATMLDLISEAQSGKLSVFELGAHFSEKCLDLTCVPGERVRTRISIDPKNREIEGHLAAQVSEWQQCGLDTACSGLVGADGVLDEVDCIVTSPGYDRAQLRKLDPLARQLVEQNLVEIQSGGGKGRNGEAVLDPHNHLTSKADPCLALVGAGNIATASDGGLSGIGVRAFYTMEWFAADLAGIGAEANPVSVEAQRAAAGAAGLFSTPPAPDSVLREILPDGTISSADLAHQTAARCFASIPRLIEMEARRLSGATLSPAERLVLRRGHQLLQRVWAMDVEFGAAAG